MKIKKTDFDRIMRGYDARRLSNMHTLSERKAEIYNAIPRYKAVEDEIADISYSRARHILMNDGDVNTDSFHKKLALLKNELGDLLDAAGYRRDYLKDIYDCKLCKDTGFVDGHRCSCLDSKIRDILYDQSQIRLVLEKENFTFFTDKYYNDSEKADMDFFVKEAKSFIDSFDSSSTNLLFWGNPGCGKTFLSNCIAKELLDTGHSVIYFTAPQLFEKMADITFNRDSSEESAGIEADSVFDCDLLIIDDLGSEIANSFTIEQLFLILNRRLLDGRSTIISTNLELQQIMDLYSERSASRILGGYHMYHFKGRDLRILKRDF